MNIANPSAGREDTRQQLHGTRSFDRSPAMRGTPDPSLRMQFHAPVRYENIRGHYWWSFQLEAPAVVWGRDGRFWAFVHDFDARSIRLILDDCRQATYDRRGGFANPFDRGAQA